MRRVFPRSRRALRGRRFVPTCALLLTLAVAVAEPRNIKPGDPIGTLALRTIDGMTVDASAWTGRPSAWLFISPQQNSSERAMIALQKAVDDTPPPGIGAVVLTCDAEHLGVLRDFAARHRIRLPIALDVGRAQYGRLGIIVMPTLLLVDRDGKLHQSMPSFTPDYEHALHAHLQFLTGAIDAKALADQLASSQPSRNLAREQAERFTQSAGVMLESGLNDEAAAELQRALAADPQYHKAALQLALLKADTGDAKAADAIVEKVLKAAPGEREARLVNGILRFRAHQLDSAEKLLNQALVLNTDPVRTHYWLGRVCEARGEWQAAALNFRASGERGLPALDRDLAK